MEMITVVIATCNDPEIGNTVQSIRASSDANSVEVIVVDDASAAKVYVQGADTVIRNQQRCGCGPSRHIGVLNANMDWVLLTDGHMRFPGDWYQAGVAAIEAHQGQDVVFCYSCIVLDKFRPTLLTARARYDSGALLHLYWRDPKKPKLAAVLEPKWSPATIPNYGEVPCLMGAAYLMRKDWFLHLAALRFLRYWGTDEAMLSLKTWLCGGSIRMINTTGIGHRFWAEGEKQGFSVKSGYTLYNKMFCAHTIMPPELAVTLAARMRLVYDRGDYVRAVEMVHENCYLIEQERRRNERIFKRTFEQYVERFGVPLPGESA